MRSHTVRAGECLSLIAHRYGFSDYKVIYDHASNADFKQKRPNPNVIHEGDVVNVPDPEAKTESVASGSVHKFVTKTLTKPLVLRLRDAAGEPLRDAAYVLTIDDVYFDGALDGDGKLDLKVPIDARQATLSVAGGYEYALTIGALNPLRDAPDGGFSGAQSRLANLGVHEASSKAGPSEHALAVYQRSRGIQVTGELDAATLDQLEKDHAS